MYVSSRLKLTLKIKKGCKDDQDFLDLQPYLNFCANSPVYSPNFSDYSTLARPFLLAWFPAVVQIE
jgi:hypothetical protein